MLPVALLTAASMVATARGLAAEVTVRFTNTPKGKDVVAIAEVGRNLLNLGDQVGVKIPRACRNGLCGACTCDVVDGLTGERTTIKACSTTVNETPDGSEILVDLARTQHGPKDDIMARSMKRFDDNWENEFVPDYKKGSNGRETPQQDSFRSASSEGVTTPLKRLPRRSKIPRDDSAALEFAPTGRPDEDAEAARKKRQRFVAVVPRDDAEEDAEEQVPVGHAKRYYHPGAAKFDSRPPWEQHRNIDDERELVPADRPPAPSLEQRFPQSNDPYAAPWDRIW